MLIYHRTSILTSQAQTVVNTVNTVGVMGKGLASEYKSLYPEMYKKYREFCKNNQFDIGMLWLWKSSEQWVLNFPTKKHWRNPSKLEYVEAGLQKFVSQYERRGISEIAFPRLGCGNGGLDWDVVRPLMEHYLANLPINIYIHDFEKNIGKAEHHEIVDKIDLLSAKSLVAQNRSFGGFLENIQKIIKNKNGKFITVKRGTDFSAKLDDCKNLIISTNSKTTKVLNEDIFDLWVMLLKGPVSKNNLSGSALETAYLLFSVLGQLPFIRLLEIASRNEKETLAIEMLGENKAEQVIIN